MSRSETKTLVLVEAEMARQHEKWGLQNHPSYTEMAYVESPADYARAWCEAKAKAGNLSWFDILFEEIFEAMDEAKAGNVDALKTELVQCGAVIGSWIESIDRNGK